jgi:hypothetical protein
MRFGLNWNTQTAVDAAGLVFILAALVAYLRRR